MPVSRTSMAISQRSSRSRRPHRPRRGGGRWPSARPRPISVNLTAFERRLRTIWRNRPGVADDRARQRPRRSAYASSMPFFAAVGASTSSAPSIASAGGRTASASSSIRPASIFEKSRMSLMIVSSASPRRRGCVSAKSRCSSSSVGVEQQPAHADDRVHRRADLVAHRGEERALRLVRGVRVAARGLELGDVVVDRVEARCARRRRSAGP